MKTKWCKEALAFVLNGGYGNNYDKDVKMADGSVVGGDFWKNNPYASVGQLCDAWNTSDLKYWKNSSLFFHEKGSHLSEGFRFINPFCVPIINANSSYNANSVITSYNYMIDSNAYADRNVNVFFGGGETTPVESDYCLESPLEKVWVSDAALDSATLAKLAVKNGNDEAIIINEIGAFGRIFGWMHEYSAYMSSNSPVGKGVSKSNYTLLERRVLEAPLTIEAGGTGILYINA